MFESSRVYKLTPVIDDIWYETKQNRRNQGQETIKEEVIGIFFFNIFFFFFLVLLVY